MSDEKGFVPNLAKFREFNIFVDETYDIVQVVKSLPYGTLALLVMAVKDILTDTETEIDEYDYMFYLRIYYFLMGVISASDERDLLVTEDHMIVLNDQIDTLSTTFSMVEGFFREIIDAKYVDGEWLFGMSKDQAQSYLRTLAKNA